MKSIEELKKELARIQAEINDLETGLTPETAAVKMRKISSHAFAGSAHSEADELLLRIIRQHGYNEAASVFENMARYED